MRWVHLSRSKERWRAVVKTAMNFWVLKKSANRGFRFSEQLLSAEGLSSMQKVNERFPIYPKISKYFEQFYRSLIFQAWNFHLFNFIKLHVTCSS